MLRSAERWCGQCGLIEEGVSCPLVDCPLAAQFLRDHTEDRKLEPSYLVTRWWRKMQLGEPVEPIYRLRALQCGAGD